MNVLSHTLQNVYSKRQMGPLRGNVPNQNHTPYLKPNISYKGKQIYGNHKPTYKSTFAPVYSKSNKSSADYAQPRYPTFSKYVHRNKVGKSTVAPLQKPHFETNRTKGVKFF